MKSINLKLANMRKPQNFIVSQTNEGFYIQSDKSIGDFNLQGVGKLNTKGSYFVHLSFGATPYTLTPEQLELCLDALTVKGDIIGNIGSSQIIYAGCTII